MEKLAGHTPANSMEVDASEDSAGAVRALVNDCKFTMNLEMANSAWKQVMGEAVRMSRCGEGTKGGKKKNTHWVLLWLEQLPSGHQAAEGASQGGQNQPPLDDELDPQPEPLQPQTQPVARPRGTDQLPDENHPTAG